MVRTWMKKRNAVFTALLLPLTLVLTACGDCMPSRSASTSSCVVNRVQNSIGTGSIQLQASPSVNVAVGASITLTATDIAGVANPAFSFQASGSGVNLSNQTQNSIVVSSTTAQAVTITVSEMKMGTTNILQTATVTLTFGTITGGNGATGDLVCELRAFYAGNNAAGLPMIEYVVGTNTGEPISITALWINGGSFTGAALPFPGSFTVSYGSIGQQKVEILAQSATTSGRTCNAGARLELTLTL